MSLQHVLDNKSFKITHDKSKRNGKSSPCSRHRKYLCKYQSCNVTLEVRQLFFDLLIEENKPKKSETK